jgi:hypothetical protein
MKSIEKIVNSHQDTLENLCSCSDVSSSELNQLREDLKKVNALSESTTPCNNLYSGINTDTPFKSSLIETFNMDDFPKWKSSFNTPDSTAHLFYFGGNSGYCEVEVIINDEGFWKIYLEGKLRTNINLEWLNIPSEIAFLKDIKALMLAIQGLKICAGCKFDHYETIVPDDLSVPVFHTRSGEPAAFVENNPSQHHKKVIRSAFCLLFIPHDELISPKNICAACEQTQNYLRTLKSRKAQIVQGREQDSSKFTRFDYLTKDELLNLIRKRTKEMRYLQDRVKKLEEHREKMVEVGKSTDDDFTIMFQNLYKGMKSRNENLQNPKCLWNACSSEKERFVDVEQLYDHVKLHIEAINNDIAPIERLYKCEWDNCTKEFTKKKLLLNHLREHTGSSSDQFFQILLNDQSKALVLPKKQMRWHPLVIKWCLRMYAKSHSAYEDLRETGFLKLPSGRLLSDYKNFSSSRSGWQMSTLQAMKKNFEKANIGKHGLLGGLFFDEVKIKEGLVFDPSTFELIGFADIENNIDDLEVPCASKQMENDEKPEEKLATHVLQFFYKSLFAKFDFPCSFFLTKGITALKLNRLFWQGVSLLHGFGFSVMVACCDGAAENRAFMDMNITDKTKSMCYNHFSKVPLFFISDPPHLMKKLRNNIYNSGFKEQNKRYTRTLEKDNKYILWSHIYSVYERDKKRRLYATDLRAAHVNLDSLSKMRVKLAVKTLSGKV